MPIVDFSYKKANNLVWRDSSQLTELVVNKTYQINEGFFPESLSVWLNGQRLSEGPSSDYVMLDPTTFELTFDKGNSNQISVTFLSK